MGSSGKVPDEVATAMSSGLPSTLRATKGGSGALEALAECRRQREQQDQLLVKAQEELQKAARLAKVAVERRVGGAEPVEVQKTPRPEASSPRVRPLRGGLRRSDEVKSGGVSASLRAAAALSPSRGFYHGSHGNSPPRRRAQTSSGRLAWAAPAAPAAPAEGEKEKENEAKAEAVEETPESRTPTAPSCPSWKRLEKTVTQYVSKRQVTTCEYEEVRQRYEGHLTELKVLCDTVRAAPEKERKAREKGAMNFRHLQDEKDFREFLELRDPLLSSRAAQRSCSPQASPRTRPRFVPEQRPKRVDEAEESVAMPLLGARMLSDTPTAENDLEHVRSLFSAQLPDAQVLKVFRVENPTLAGVYAAVRDTMGSECELDLWHGTSSSCVPNIVLNGFNRAYSGRSHGTKLGHGSYFSASAAYSTRFCDRKRQRKTVFFAKVLVGVWAKGSPELVEPPCREGLLRYDSTVDDVQSPVNFCIFRDFQAMPTYLLEFV